MSALLAIFLNNILPILLVVSAGFLLGRTMQVDPRTLSKVVFYIFSPSLLFTLITDSQLANGDIVRMMSMATTHIFVIGALTWLIGQALKLPRRLLIAIILTSMFMNSGNFGLSVNAFAFGEATLAQASVFFATQGILVYSVGVLIASLGQYPLREALVGLLKIPIIYALLLAFLFVRFGWQLPLPLDRTVDLLAQAAIPAMLVLLGLQLHAAHWAGRLGPLALSNGIRLGLSPLVALGLTALLGLQGAARQAGVLESAMPAGVITTVLATEYDLEPAFVTMVVLTSTLISPFTLTPLLAYLGA